MRRATGNAALAVRGYDGGNVGYPPVRRIALVLISFWCWRWRSSLSGRARVRRSPREITEATFPSVVLLTMKDVRRRVIGLGSGFFVRPDVIATNFHVIKSAVSGEAKVVARSARCDRGAHTSPDEARVSPC